MAFWFTKHVESAQIELYSIVRVGHKKYEYIWLHNSSRHLDESDHETKNCRTGTIDDKLLKDLLSSKLYIVKLYKTYNELISNHFTDLL